jgi:hypothetical protein
VCSPLEPYRSIFNLRAHIKRENENPKNSAGVHAQVVLPEGGALVGAEEGEAAGGEGGAAGGEGAEGDAAAEEGDAAAEEGEGAAAVVVPEAVM